MKSLRPKLMISLIVISIFIISIFIFVKSMGYKEISNFLESGRIKESEGLIFLLTNEDVRSFIDKCLTLKEPLLKKSEFETEDEYKERLTNYKEKCAKEFSNLKERLLKIEHRYEFSSWWLSSWNPYLKFARIFPLDFSLGEYQIEKESFSIKYDEVVRKTYSNRYELFYEDLPELKIDRKNAKTIRELQDKLVLEIIGSVKDCEEESEKDYPYSKQYSRLIVKVLQVLLKTKDGHILWQSEIKK